MYIYTIYIYIYSNNNHDHHDNIISSDIFSNILNDRERVDLFFYFFFIVYLGNRKYYTLERSVPGFPHTTTTLVIV